MQLPQTPLQVVFKSSRLHNKMYAEDLTTIKSSSRMGELPTNTVTVWGSDRHTIYRYVGDNPYNYACIGYGTYRGNEYVDLSGGTRTPEEFINFFETVQRLRPFVSKLFNR